MRSVEDFMKDFMDNLHEGEFKKENQPNNGPNIDAKFVKKKVERFKKIMDSEVVGRVMNGAGAE